MLNDSQGRQRPEPSRPEASLPTVVAAVALKTLQKSCSVDGARGYVVWRPKELQTSY